MEPHRLALFCVEPDASDAARQPISHVYVKSHFSLRYPGHDEKLILLTHPAHNIRELEDHIDWLQNELELLRQRARRHYAEAG